jgi:peptide/nickel transport system substrate-binding protein
MKKSIVFILIAALIFSLAACGTNSGTNSGANSGANASVSPGDSSSSDSPAESDLLSSMPEPGSGVTLDTFKNITGDVARYKTESTGKVSKADPTTLYVGQITNIQNMNPASCGDSPFVDLVFDQLVTIDFNTGEYVGKVLKDWKVADDYSSVDITMNDNITFHDGSKATMKDVLYTLQRYADPKLAAQADRNEFGNVDFDKSKIIDDYNGKIVFKTPTINFIAGLTKCWLLSKDYITSKGEDNAWWSSTVGSGQYKVESVVQGDRYNLVRNDSYWGTKGAFNKIVIRFYAEASTLYIDFQTGKLDIAINPFSTDVQRVINGEVKDTTCDIYPMMCTFNVIFDEEKNPALGNENLRKAISLAIDPATVTEMAYSFLGLPSISILPRGLRDAYTLDHVQDIDAAKKALADAGYKPGQLTLVWGTNSQNVNKTIAETIQAELSEIGINLNIITADPTQHILNIRNTGTDTYDMTVGLCTIGTLDPTIMLANVSKACGSVDFGAVTDPEADKLATAVKTSLTEKDQETAMIALQKYLLDHYWMVPISDQKAAILYKDYITGIRVIQPRYANLTGVTLAG